MENNLNSGAFYNNLRGVGINSGVPIGSQYGFRQAPGAATGAFSSNNILANPTFPAGQAGVPVRQAPAQNENKSFTGALDTGDFMIKNLREAQNPKKTDTKKNTSGGSFMDQVEAALKQTMEMAKNFNADGTPKESAKKDDDDAYDISYTYKPGDTFGQVVKNLGLGTKKGLWGDDGDVEYYTKQLEKQLWKSGVWPKGSRQNIPVGTTIKLRRRPETE